MHGERRRVALPGSVGGLKATLRGEPTAGVCCSRTAIEALWQEPPHDERERIQLPERKRFAEARGLGGPSKLTEAQRAQIYEPVGEADVPESVVDCASCVRKKNVDAFAFHLCGLGRTRACAAGWDCRCVQGWHGECCPQVIGHWRVACCDRDSPAVRSQNASFRRVALSCTWCCRCQKVRGKISWLSRGVSSQRLLC